MPVLQRWRSRRPTARSSLDEDEIDDGTSPGGASRHACWDDGESSPPVCQPRSRPARDSRQKSRCLQLGRLPAPSSANPSRLRSRPGGRRSRVVACRQPLNRILHNARQLRSESSTLRNLPILISGQMETRNFGPVECVIPSAYRASRSVARHRQGANRVRGSTQER